MAQQGLIDYKPSVLTPLNDYFSDTLNINVVGTWCLIREAMPHLKRSGDGNIINITSCAGIDPASASSAIPYSVAKAAIKNHGRQWGRVLPFACLKLMGIEQKSRRDPIAAIAANDCCFFYQKALSFATRFINNQYAIQIRTTIFICESLCQ